MQKFCEICEQPISDGDEVIALVVSRFRAIPSSTTFAIEKPTACIGLQHAKCDENYEGPECQIIE